MGVIITIDLHGLTLEQAKMIFESRIINAFEFGEYIVRVIHGKGKHSEVFPVIKSYVRHWLEDSDFAQQYIETVYRGEDGSPYTSPNGGETIIVFKGQPSPEIETLNWDDNDDNEKRENSKRIRANKLRKLRRQQKHQ